MPNASRALRFRPWKTRTGIDRDVRYLVRHARSIPYYRRAFEEAGIDEVAIQGVADLPHLPVTKRVDLSQLPTADYTAPEIELGRCVHHSTSGSSGTPLMLFMSRSEAAYRKLILARVLLRFVHLRPPVRIVEFGRVLRPNVAPVMRVGGLLTVAKPSGLLPSAEQLTWLDRYHPQIVEGFPTALEDLAQHAAASGAILHTPRLVVCRGEVLLPETRTLLERVFRAPVVDQYNCEEVGNVAWQCPADPSKMHINVDACVVEIVDENGEPAEAGQTGFIALTNLFNNTMPFIRYIIGDRGRLLPSTGSRCLCGARTPTMALVDGRSDDHVVLPDGTPLSPRVVATVLFRRPDGSRIRGIQRYQIIQETRDELVVDAVLEEHIDPDWASLLRATASEALGGLQLRTRIVDNIPFEHSGKYKRVISRLTDGPHRPQSV